MSKDHTQIKSIAKSLRFHAGSWFLQGLCRDPPMFLLCRDFRGRVYPSHFLPLSKVIPRRLPYGASVINDLTTLSCFGQEVVTAHTAIGLVQNEALAAGGAVVTWTDTDMSEIKMWTPLRREHEMLTRFRGVSREICVCLYIYIQIYIYTIDHNKVCDLFNRIALKVQ